MSIYIDEASSWSAALEIRRTTIRSHPMYPVLVRKVARAEAARRSGSKVPIVRDNCGPDHPTMDAYAWARRMVLDLFPDPWPSHGDMLAAIYDAARDDVEHRVDTRA